MNKSNMKYKGSFIHQKASGRLQLSLVAFVGDDSNYFVYCPALDLTGYGHNEDEAKISFEQTLKMYMNYTINKETFVDDLKAHGWIFKNKKHIASPPFSDMLKSNKEFENIVEKRNFTKYTHELEIPDCVYA